MVGKRLWFDPDVLRNRLWFAPDVERGHVAPQCAVAAVAAAVGADPAAEHGHVVTTVAAAGLDRVAAEQRRPPPAVARADPRRGAIAVRIDRSGPRTVQ